MGVRRDLAAWYAGAAYTASAAVCCVAAARSQANFVDLHVYRMGGAAVLHGGDLYRLRFAWPILLPARIRDAADRSGMEKRWSPSRT